MRMDERRARAARRVEFEAKKDLPPQEDDSDPEANLEAILEMGQAFDASYAPPADFEPRPLDTLTGAGSLRDNLLPALDAPPGPDPYGTGTFDPNWAEKAIARGKAEMEATANAYAAHLESLIAKQEAARLARAAEKAARRAAQESKRGVMKRARASAARSFARALEQAESVENAPTDATLGQLLPRKFS
jgi:hypothetical protein